MKSFFFILLLGISATAFGQEIKNIEVSTTDDLLVINYDLKGEKDSVYQVDLLLFDQSGQALKATSLNGDIGKVEAGIDKTIVWNVYKDVDGIEGTINPEITVRSIPQPKKTFDVAEKPKPKAPIKMIDVLRDDEKKRKSFRYGIKLGYGTSSVRTNVRDLFYERKGSFEGGLFFRWYPHKRIHFQPELVYKQHHFEEIINSNESVIHRHKYVRPQLILGIAPIGGGLHFNIGAYYGYLFSGEKYNDLNTSNVSQNLDPIKPENVDAFPFSKEDVGFIIGGSFSVFRGAFVIGVQHTRGFDSFVEGSYLLRDQVIENQQLINKSTQFYIQKSF